MKKILLLLVAFQFNFVAQETNLFGSQIGRNTFYFGSEILQYDVEGTNGPGTSPTFTLKPELAYFFWDNIGIFAKYYRTNGTGEEYGLGVMATFPTFYVNGVYKDNDTDDKHWQGTMGKLFQLSSPSQMYLNLGLNFSLYSEEEEKQLQLMIEGLYFGIAFAF